MTARDAALVAAGPSCSAGLRLAAVPVGRRGMPLSALRDGSRVAVELRGVGGDGDGDGWSEGFLCVHPHKTYETTGAMGALLEPSVVRVAVAHCGAARGTHALLERAAASEPAFEHFGCADEELGGGGGGGATLASALAAALGSATAEFVLVQDHAARAPQ